MVLMFLFALQAVIGQASSNTQANFHTPYNQMTHLMSHNASSNENYGSLALLGYTISNQNISLTEQFRAGARAFKIPVYEFQGQRLACHGAIPELISQIAKEKCSGFLSFFDPLCTGLLKSSSPCIMDPATRPLSDVLHEISHFLEEAPSEVFTLVLEDHTGDYSGIREEFKKSGLNRLLFDGSDLRSWDLSWPTLQELVTSGKRLMTFMDDHTGSRFHETTAPFIPTDIFLCQTAYKFTSVAALSEDSGNRCYGPLWTLPHFVTPSLGGRLEDAEHVNEYSFIKERVQKYMRIQKRQPFLLSVDFIQAHKGVDGVTKLISELNNR